MNLDARIRGRLDADQAWTRMVAAGLDEVDGPELTATARAHRDAITAVLDLHSDNGEGGCTCSLDVDPLPWPCDTVRAITSSLMIEVKEDEQ